MKVDNYPVIPAEPNREPLAILLQAVWVEALYQDCRVAQWRAGKSLSREEFWHKPGFEIVVPAWVLARMTAHRIPHAVMRMSPVIAPVAPPQPRLLVAKK